MSLKQIKTQEDMANLIGCTKKKIGEESGFYGECANFAEALQKVVGGEVWCAWTDEYHVTERGPAHCSLKWKNKFWDIDGKPKTKDDLEQWAYPDNPDTIYDDIQWTKDDIVCGPSYGTGSYKYIRDEKIINKIKSILKGCLK